MLKTMGISRSIGLPIVMAVILAMSLPTATVGAAPGEQGNTISYGQTVQGSISDEEWANEWVFEGHQGDVISISMTATSGNLDTYLFLLDPTGRLVAADDDGSGSTDSLIPRYPLPMDGQYSIIATRYRTDNGDSTGTYSLTLTLLQQGFTPQPGVLEFNLSWNNYEDLDLVIFEPGGGVPIHWSHTNSESGAVLTSNGNDYCRNPTTSPSEQVRWIFGNAPTGTYRVQVRYSLECEGTQGRPVQFQVTVLVDGQPVDSFGGQVSFGGEPFETEWEYTGPVATLQTPAAETPVATPFIPGGQAPDCGPMPEMELPPEITTETISYGETLTGEIDDQHYGHAYFFCGSEGDEIEVTMTATSGNLQPLVQLADAGGTTLRENYAQLGRTASISYTLPETGWYVIGTTRVGFANGTSSGGFSVTLNVAGGMAAAPEPTSPVIPLPTLPDGSQPTQLSYGDTYWGTIDDSNPYQWFAFGGGQGDQVTISVEAVSGDLIPHLQLGDANLNLIDEAIGSPTQRRVTLNFTPPETGWYLIGVSRAGGETGTTSGDYMLTLQGTPSQVQPLGVPTTVPTPQTGGGLQIILSWTAPADLDLQVQEPDGTLIYYNEPHSPTGGEFESNGNDFCRNISANPSESVTWATAPPSGQYQISIHYFDGCGYTGPVEFTITIIENAQVVDVVSGTVTAPDERFSYSYTR